MKIAITHIKPDFDAIASAYGAYRLHDLDHIAIITNTENNVNDFISNSDIKIPIVNYNNKLIQEIDKIELLVITDCSSRLRVGALAELIDKAEKIIIYDHHVTSECDIDYTEAYIEDIGSTTTKVSELLKEKDIDISPIEATFLSLGVYEDTGLLTFSKTTPRDALAIAYLLSKNADSTVCNDYIQRELSQVQIMLLNELLLNLSIITVGGVDVAYSFATVDEYVGEAAFIAHKLMIIEGLSSLFILVSTGGRLILIGRSNDKRVDVQKVVSYFGGGGHSVAGSAVIKDKMIAETIDNLKFVIRDAVKPLKTVQEIMTTHVKSVESDTSLEDTLNYTLKHNLNHLPVVVNNRSIGIISRKDLIQSIKHGLGNETVNSIMQTEYETVKPDTPFYDAEEIMVYENQKLLPVETSEKGIVGVLTRTDLLRLMHEDIIVQSAYAQNQRKDLGILKNRNIKSKMVDFLKPEILNLLVDIGKFAEEKRVKAYVVGGFVRDLIMKKPNFDIDIVIEGDATIFAIDYAKYHNAKVSTHQKFKTAVVTFNTGFKIDFATARTEYYITPAAAPEVSESSVKSDLFRRDFTINAMAVRLDGEKFGNLLDFFLGQKDIRDKKIRILHSLSFIDDPSRAFRAIRFAVRFGFDIGVHTEKLLKHAESLDLFSRIIGNRRFLELKYILAEDGYLIAIQMLNKYNMLRFFHKRININNEFIERFKRVENIIHWYNIQTNDNSIKIWRIRFYLFFFSLKRVEFDKCIDDFDISIKDSNILKNDFKFIEYANSLFKRYKNQKPSFIYGICKELSIESLLSLAAILGEERQEIIKDYLTNYKFVKIELDGNDLMELGVKKGPDIKLASNELLKLKLDGEILNKEDEIKYIKNKFGDKN